MEREHGVRRDGRLRNVSQTRCERRIEWEERLVNGVPMTAALVAGLARSRALGGLALRLGGTLSFWAGLAGLLAGGGAIGALSPWSAT
jgi:hypothetical protein